MHPIRQISAVLVLSLLSAAWACAQEENLELKSLDTRVETLEKAVVKDPFHPRETVLARLKALEDRLDAADRSGGISQKSEAKDDAQLRRSLDLLTREVKDLDQRLKRSEDVAGRNDQPASALDLRDIKSTLSQLTRSMSDLQERVRRLELKK